MQRPDWCTACQRHRTAPAAAGIDAVHLFAQRHSTLLDRRCKAFCSIPEGCTFQAMQRSHIRALHDQIGVQRAGKGKGGIARVGGRQRDLQLIRR